MGKAFADLTLCVSNEMKILLLHQDAPVPDLLENAVKYSLGGLLHLRQGVVPVERREGRLEGGHGVWQAVEDEPAEPHDRALVLLPAVNAWK